MFVFSVLCDSIFSPFDALKGFSEAIAAKEEIYEPRRELGEQEKEVLMEAATRSSLTREFLVKLAKPLLTSGEIRPTDLVPVIAPNRNGEKAVFPMKWGFSISGKSSPLVNARIETAAQKPTFKECWIRRRCVIPASWYFEWSHYKTPDGKTKTGDKFQRIYRYTAI